MNIRLIATDLDGTLLDADRAISPRARRALRACREKGVGVMFASGRSFEAVARLAREAGLKDCLILSCNGSRLDETASGPLLFEDNLPEDIAREAAGRLVSAGLYVECYSDERVYMATRVPLPTRNHQPGLTADGTVEFVDDAARLLEEGPKKARKLIVKVLA